MDAVGEQGEIDASDEKLLADVYNGYTYFLENDILIAKITPCFENGKGAIARGLKNGVGFGTTEFHVLRPLQGMSERWLFYLTKCDFFRKIGGSEMLGAGGQKRLPEEFIRNLRVGIPSFSEQERIADFLDWKTGQIDALIAKKRALIEKLKEKRLAVVMQAVTKGLDPAVPMRDSGISWLGLVPEKWLVLPIKYLLDSIIDTEHKTCPFYDDGEFLVARTTNIKDGKLSLDGAKYTDADGYREWTMRAAPKAGDIIFTREAPAGEACIVPDKPTLCVGQRVVLFRTNPDVLDSSYAINSIYGGAARVFIEMHSLGSTVTHFNMSEIAMIPMLLPPLDEQKAISKHLEEKTSVIDFSIREVEEVISRLTEYRTALITAATTGQIDVRNVAIPAHA